MQIYKVINNNMVSVRNENGQEVMLKGLSIGFNKKANDPVDETKIEQKFVLDSETIARRFNEMIVDVDRDVVDVCMDVVTTLKRESKVPLSDSIYVTFIDHVANLVDRTQMGIKFDNSVLWDVKRIYPEEYRLAVNAVKELDAQLPYEFEDNEACFIALHIVNSEVLNNMHQTYRLTHAITDICDIVSSNLETEFEENDYYYNRFVMHLRYMLENGKLALHDDANADTDILDTLSMKHPKARSTVEKISTYISSVTLHQLNKEQKLYLMIHLAQMVKNRGIQ